VADSDCTLCKSCHLLYNTHYQQAVKTNLTTCYRQAEDQPLLNFLNTIRAQVPTQSQIDACLGKCLAAASTIKEHFEEGVTILCTHNKDVKKHNASALRWHHEQDLLGGCIYPVDAGVEPLHLAAMNPDLKPWVDKNHLLTEVAVGARVMFTKTLDKATGKVRPLWLKHSAVVIKLALMPPCWLSRWKHHYMRNPI
jgi:hypothetical protein